MAKIIIIDDEPGVRSIMCRILQRAGHQVRTAEAGDGGLELQRSDPADLVITDLHMPGKSGLETIAALRRTHPELTILAMSGSGTSRDPGGELDQALQGGADGILAKPFDVGGLQQAVAALLVRKARERDAG